MLVLFHLRLLYLILPRREKRLWASLMTPALQDRGHYGLRKWSQMADVIGLQRHM